jgi:hypothetical protein
LTSSQLRLSGLTEAHGVYDCCDACRKIDHHYYNHPQLSKVGACRRRRAGPARLGAGSEQQEAGPLAGPQPAAIPVVATQAAPTQPRRYSEPDMNLVTPLTTVVLVLPAMQQQWASNVRIYSSTPPRLPSPLLMSAKSRLVSAFSMIASVRLFLLSRLCFTTRACSSADSIICA